LKKKKVAAPPEEGEVEQAPPAAKRRKKVVASTDAEVSIEPQEADEVLQKSKKRRKAPDSEPTEVAAAVEPAEQADAKLKGKSGKRLKQARKKAAAESVGQDDAGDADGDADGTEADGDTARQAHGEPKKGAGSKANKADDCTIFVSGVPYVWQLDKLREVFAKCGDVLEVRAPTWQDSGRLRGYAHITFSERRAKEEAISMDGMKVGSKGRFLKIEAAKAPGEGTTPSVSPQDVVGKKRLFVKNLPYDATEVEIKTFFGKFGTIADVRVPTSFGRAKGFAYVEYAKSESLAKAVTKGSEFRGRKLFLDVDAGGGPKAGFHYRPSAYEQEGVKAGGGKAGGRGTGKGGGRGPGRGPKL